jgi:hypothetical protein
MATTIDQPVVHGYSGPFGWPQIATVGQTITGPGQRFALPRHVWLLNQFTFHYRSDYSHVGPIVRGEVYAWDGAKAMGPGVWESLPQQVLDTTFGRPVTFQTGAIALRPGQPYVLFVSISKDYARNVAEVPAGVNDYSSWGTASAELNGDVDPYPGGDYVFLDNGADWGAWTSQDWGSHAPYVYDMYFSASFTRLCALRHPVSWLTSSRRRRS